MATIRTNGNGEAEATIGLREIFKVASVTATTVIALLALGFTGLKFFGLTPADYRQQVELQQDIRMEIQLLRQELLNHIHSQAHPKALEWLQEHEGRLIRLEAGRPKTGG